VYIYIKLLFIYPNEWVKLPPTIERTQYLYFRWWNIGAIGSGDVAAEFGTALSGDCYLSAVCGEGGWVDWTSTNNKSHLNIQLTTRMVCFIQDKRKFLDSR
jgi:hypothetical protein